MEDRTDFFDYVPQGYTYDDLLLVPSYSEILSRRDPVLNSEIVKGLSFNVPIISANMASITEDLMATSMVNFGASAAIHRFLYPKRLKEIFDNMEYKVIKKIGISLGVKKEEAYLFLKEIENYIEHIGYFVIDISHADHILVKNFIKEIKSKIDKPIIAGNICTQDAAFRLIEWGADSLKIGIGPGRNCTTRKVAGVGYPQLSAIKWIYQGIKDRSIDNVKLIADGGIRTSGDIVKSLAAGADFVMLGGMLAGTKETPGNPLTLANNSMVKVYEGSASLNAQIKFREKPSSEIVSEGVSNLVEYKGSVDKFLPKIIQGVKNGLSYCGCSNIKEIQNYGEDPLSWVRITYAGSMESEAHGT